MERKIKRSISVAVRNGDQILLVQRPPDDEDLPNAWGLPAASLRQDETWHDAVVRSGREKLGVELSVAQELEHGTLQRAAYVLEMRLYEAVIARGSPTVPQREKSVTQYQDWKWGSADELRPAAARGSLCSQLYLASHDRGSH